MNPFARPRPKTRALLKGKRALQFDGNAGDDMRHWLFASDDFHEKGQKALEELMEAVVEDRSLNWVLFPPEGYRL